MKMMATVHSSWRWTNQFPVEVYVNITSPTGWIHQQPVYESKKIIINHKHELIDLDKILDGYDVEYVVYRVQSFINREGQTLNFNGGDNCLVGVLDDVLNEADAEMCQFVDDTETDYLIFTVNRNQIPKYRDNTNAECLFMPIPLMTPTDHMSILGSWEGYDRYPAVAYSAACQSPHRTEVGAALLRTNTPATIINHNGLSINPGLVNKFYHGNPPTNFNHFDVMMNYVYKTYSTHFGAINTPRHPMSLTHRDPGHFVYRITEIIGCGALLFQRKIPQDSGLYHIFTPDLHFVEWETCDELVDKVMYYIKNRDEAQKIAEAGLAQMNRKISTLRLRMDLDNFLRKDKLLQDFACYE